MKRILIVNVNWLGDTVFVMPFIKAVRENHPDSYIAILTHPRCLEVLKGNPYINEIIIYDEKRGVAQFLGKFAVISKLRSKKFDTAFILRRSLSRTMLLFLSKIPERIGYDNRKSGFLLTKKIPLPSKDLHMVEHFLGIARGIGMQPKSVDYEFFISEKDRDEGKVILRQKGIKDEDVFIVINPGGNWDLKRWPAENFAKLGDEIFSKLNIKIVLTGGDMDIPLCKQIFSLMEKKPILLCGETDLKTLAAIFERAKWVVSNDSGPMHIAAGIGTPVCSLFGPTSSRITGPYGKGVHRVLQKDIGCSIPCYNLGCKDNKCMKAITVEDVLKVIS